MAVSWSSSLDFHLELEPGVAPGTALADAIRAAVRAGRLPTGAPVPSTRALAADLGVARGTVSSVFSRLAAEGYLLTAQGAPTRVAELMRGSSPDETRPVVGSRADPAPRWNFRPGLPDVSMFPRQQWQGAARSALADVPAADLGFPIPGGHPVLRSALAEYLGRARGVIADQDRVVVCAGYGHALSLLCNVLHAEGVREIAFENPSLWRFRDIATDSGMRIAPIGVDGRGMRVSDVDSPAVVVTAAHQFPLGVPLHPARRAELAARSDVVIIEDDYDGEFRYTGPKVGALQALAPERVVYAGTASKTLAPGLRLSWLVLPRSLVAPVRAAMQRDRVAAGVLDQITLAEFLRTGRYDQHVRRCRGIYRRRYQRLVAAMDGLPVVPHGIPAGLHALLRLPEGRTEDEYARALRQADIAAETLGRYWCTPGPHPQGLIIGYSAPAQHAFAPALTALTSALASVT